ncbi:zinc ribbon domain-containing protein [Micromonospora sp. NPDC049366]|uniref:zinc ribbon domain-containing protein n=1 Tax=Micromonospora sp. NPDC049366 TaxID=3364271 RepID=UPI0037BB3855
MTPHRQRDRSRQVREPVARRPVARHGGGAAVTAASRPGGGTTCGCTSSTCPACQRRIPKPRGRTLNRPHCTYTGHRDLVAAAMIATRTPGGGPTTPTTTVLPGLITHRRAGRHLPGAGQSRRDPRRPPATARAA